MIETERLALRMPDRNAYILLRDLVADPEVQRFLGPPAEDPTTDMFSRTLRGAGSWQLYGYGTFLVWEKGGSFAGQAGIFHTLRGFGKGMDDVPEAAWMFAREHWGKGYALEAMRAALDWFDTNHKAPRTTCMIEPANTASIRLADRLGFVRYDGHMLGDGAAVDLFERISQAG